MNLLAANPEPIRTVLVEDEPYARLELIRMSRSLNLGLEFEAELDSVRSARRWLSENPPPELLILDIQLSDGLSFEILETLETQIPVLFTTAYDHFALRAFKEFSVDYLLKPVEPEEFKHSIEKFRTGFKKTIAQEVDYTALSQFLTAKMAPEPYRKRFLGKLGGKIFRMDSDRIAYVYTKDELVYLRSISGERMVSDSSLDQIEAELDPDRFFRVSRNLIAMVDSIKKMERYGSGQWLLHLEPDPGERILVSRARAKDFERWFDR